jgi:putative ABC transport system ATP-binding protein
MTRSNRADGPGDSTAVATSVSEPVIELEGVTCRFESGDRRVVALDDVSLAVARRSFVAVMGATGSGKSTLLNCAAGLERPTAGAVRLVGRDITHASERSLAHLRRDHVGFVFQSYNLLSELTVEQNVLLPRRLGGRGARSAGAVLAAVGLEGLSEQPVGELSGGQRQRVAIARAVAANPDVIFADEPTGALDAITGHRVLALLRDAVDRLGLAVVMVTHDPIAASVSDRLVLLRDGRIIDDRTTPNPATITDLLRAATPVTSIELR